jgi:hypothetical protein
MDSTRRGACLCPWENTTFKEGGIMVKVNLLPERQEAAIWRKMEKALWILWFSLPFTILLWAKLDMNSK